MINLDDYFFNFMDGNKLAIIGVGSVLNSDDAAGMVLIQKLEQALRNCKEILLIAASTAPENFTGMLRDFSPSRIIIVDAANIEEKTGSIGLIPMQLISGVSFSTHMLPLTIFLHYVNTVIACPVAIIGIQPKSTAIGFDMSSEVLSSVNAVCQSIINAVQGRYAIKV